MSVFLENSVFVEDIQKFDSYDLGYKTREARIKKGMKAIDMAVLLEMSQRPVFED